MSQNWKESLLMPQTDFAMKADLTSKEVVIRKTWLDNKIYQKSLALNKNNKRFILHDGPPYANGSLHVGHALNKILKDIIIRRKNMEGFYAPFVPGWDTHGLPIENKMLSEMKMTKDDLDPVSLRKEAAKYALVQVENQKQQFESMQLFSDFKEKYITLNKDYEVAQLELFKKMCLDGIIYKGLKPIYWSPSSQSALAEAEVEYQDHMSPQVIIAFKIKKGNQYLNPNDSLLIMTTTPWTLIANSGVAVGKDFDYDIVEVDNLKYVVASALIQEVATKAKWEKFEVLKTIKGSCLVGLEYICPIKRDLVAPVVLGHHVSTEEGTGLVHMAPLFGEDDYLVGKKNNLNMIMHVDDKGYLTKEANEYEGKFYADANKDIGLFLDKHNEMLSLKFIKHSYPHDWRTHKPVIYRGVPQWFVNIESIKNDILDALNVVKSTPEWGVSRISKMIETRSEWTISRQRTWGVPIIVFYDQNKEPVIKEELFNYVIDLVSQEGTDVWWEKDTDQLLPEKYRNQNWTREMDIMDVWFDSGSSSIAVKPMREQAPFELYLEGSDQYRGWFNSSLINSVAYRKQAPYKYLISHGFVLDGKQQKMSKSKGNVIDPLEVIHKSGADILRLWVANSEYTSDVSISDNILKQNIEIYRRLRNTIRFMIANLFDFDYNENQVELTGVHKFISEVNNNYVFKVNKLYNEYKFIDIVKETNKLFIDLSGWYFDYAKDILYCNFKDDFQRRSIQTNIFNILESALIALAPIIPSTIEEAFQHLKLKSKQESIFLERKIENLEDIKYDKNISQFYFHHIPEANKVLEDARKINLIKRNNEAVLTVKIKQEEQIASAAEYAKYFMVAKVIFGNEWKVSSFDSQKCQRCWNHFESHELNNEICHRCTEVVNK